MYCPSERQVAAERHKAETIRGRTTRTEWHVHAVTVAYSSIESLLIIKRQDRPIRAENYADFFGIITLLQKKA